MITDSNPIGIFDSGLGGLTIWSACSEVLPQESYVYFADHAYVPYGTKSTKEIVDRVLVCLKWLQDKQCKLIVVACNTATVAGIDVYRKNIPHIPIVGVVPVIKKAAEITKTNYIAVLSTPFTAKSTYQAELIHKFALGKSVETVAVPGLVSCIESGQIDERSISRELQPIVKQLSNAIDTVVLGCTHFPFVAESIKRQLPPYAQLIDSSGAVARQVQRVLDNNRQLANGDNKNTIFYTTGNHRLVGRVASKLMKKDIQFSPVRL